MHCRICGETSTRQDVIYRERQRQTLCRVCAAQTPRKVGRKVFDLAYWGTDQYEVTDATKREFYADYLASTNTLADYVASTTA